MTPQEIAEVRPRLLDFAAGMLGGLPRKDQRAAGELYVRGLLTDGQRKSMQPMAERLGVDHQRLQQFITSSTWDYAVVRRNVARWFASSQPVEALVVDDTGFPKDGDASPCVARQYSGTLGKTANCQIGVSVHLVNEHASCAADWRLFCPESWDDAALADPVAAAGARRRRERAGIPDEVRYREKWRLALDMIQEMTGPGGWGVLDLVAAARGARPVVAADIGYGDNALFREQLTAAGWQYAVAVKGGTTAHPAGAVPQARAYGGLGQPPKPAYPGPPVTVRQLAIAAADQVRPVTWRQGTKTSKDNPEASMTGQPFRQRWLVRAGRGDTCLMTSHQQSRAGEVAVSGGRMTSGMTRRGDRLLRPMGPWSPAVHEYLRHLEAAGFDGAPRLLGIEVDREVLTFIDGDVANDPRWQPGHGHRLPPYARTDLALRGAGRLIRELHTAAAGFRPRITSYRFDPRPPGPGQIVSHGDLGPWNTVYRDGMPVAFIDWDAAQPVDPVADLASAAQAFVPLAPPGLLAEAGFDPLPDLAARLRTFLDAYGLTDRKAILPELQRCALDEEPSAPWLRATLPDLGRRL